MALSATDNIALQAQLHYELGVALADSNDMQDAEAQFRESIRLNPAVSVGAYMRLGSILEKEGKLDEALEEYRQAIQLLPTAEAYVLLGNALQRANRSQEAQSAYRNALQRDPQSKEARQKLQELNQGTQQN
jgi:tetratricopeptide (TPR) repeat protein